MTPIKLAKPTPAPVRTGPEPLWRVRAIAARAERRAREARGELLSTDHHIEGILPNGEPRHEAAAIRERAVILEAAKLRPLGQRMTPRGNRRPALRTWFVAPDGEGYEVLKEVTAASLGDPQPMTEVLLHVIERRPGSIEEAKGRRIPRPDSLVSRWFRAKVHAAGSWSDAD